MSGCGEKRRSAKELNIPFCVSLVIDNDVKISKRIYSFTLQKDVECDSGSNRE
jgi:hypothetical protein